MLLHNPGADLCPAAAAWRSSSPCWTPAPAAGQCSGCGPPPRPPPGTRPSRHTTLAEVGTFMVRCHVVMLRKLTSNGSEKRQLSIPRQMTDPCRHTPELDSVSVNIAWMQLLSPRTRILRCDDTKQSKMIYRTFGLLISNNKMNINQSWDCVLHSLTNINKI